MELVTLISALLAIVGFIMYNKTQEKLVKRLKSEINELNKKVEQQEEIINTFYGNKSIE